MERFTEELLSDIDKDTVNMIPTFDENTTEPEVLPAKFPNLLVNGSMGIGVGMATKYSAAQPRRGDRRHHSSAWKIRPLRA